MIKIVLAFFIIFFLIGTAIAGFREMSNLERWSLTKIIVYGTILSVITVGVMTSLVVLF